MHHLFHLSRRISHRLSQGISHRTAGVAVATLAFSLLSAADIALPDPLLGLNGIRVTSGADWLGRRRPELLEIFSREIYGRPSVQRPADLTFTVTNSKTGMMGGAADLKEVRIAWKGPRGSGGLDLVLFVPSKRTAPAPCMLLICNRGKSNIDPTRARKSEFWPAEEMIARGYAAAAFYNGDVDPDSDDGFKNGVHGVFDTPSTTRPADAWGTIAAWAWGARRAMDYLSTDPGVDAGRVAVVGHSRGGKTSLWAGAQDQRFALTISNDSGSSGAAAARGKGGQNIQQITREFPHWFNVNYRGWGDREWQMPFDQHEVLALCAPRLAYVASASEDWGADPKAEFRSCVQASPVWQLWGKTGVSSTTFPANNTPLHGGSIGYHVRAGAHDLKLYDWQRFMDFADRHLTTANATNVVSIVASDATADEAGATGSVVVSRSGSTLSALTVTLSVAGTATAGTDYNALANTVIIPAGAKSATVTIVPKADAVADANETVIVRLPIATNYALGASKAATVTIAETASFSASINFQPAPSSAMSGWLTDAGAPFARRSNGMSYGWNEDIADTARDRNSSRSGDQMRDTLLHLQKPEHPTARWEIAVPNGLYAVRLIAGDPDFFDSSYRLAVEGTLVINATPDTTNRWFDQTKNISVSDGRITLTSASGARNNKVCAIEIVKLPNAAN